MLTCSITLSFDSAEVGAPVEAKKSAASTRAVKITKSWYVNANANDRKAYMSGGGVYLRYNIILESGVQKYNVYVGETENFEQRFVSHKTQRTGEEEYWTSAILFRDDDLASNTDLRRAIEFEIAKKCKSSGNCICKTSKTAKDSSQCECDTLNSYLRHIGVLCRSMGFEWLEEQSVKVMFVCDSPKNKAHGVGYMSANGFTICEGSILSDNIKDTLKPKGYRNTRLAIEGDRSLVANRKLMRNIEVDNASMAAAIVLGATSNGNDKWKKADDKMTLGEYVNKLD